MLAPDHAAHACACTIQAAIADLRSGASADRVLALLRNAHDASTRLGEALASAGVPKTASAFPTSVSEVSAASGDNVIPFRRRQLHR